MLVALLRQHFQKKQEKHTHRGLLPPKLSTRPPTGHRVGDSALEDSSSRLTVPALTRAKMAITNSFENLRSKPALDKKRKLSQHEKAELGQLDASQSLNVRSVSPLFARKTNIDTLMAPVATSPLKEESRGRERSWTAGVRRTILPRVTTSNDKNQEEKNKDKKEQNQEEKNIDEEEEKQRDKAQSETATTPHRTVLHKRRKSPGNLQRDRPPLRHSLTPPSGSGVEKYLQFRGHRRSTSNIISRSWRQEIFDSVSTPTKLDGGFRASDDICKYSIVP